MNRRDFIKVAMAAGAYSLVGHSLAQTNSGPSRVRALEFKAQKVKHQFHSSVPQTELWSFTNGGMSPQLRLKQGHTLNINLANELSQDVALHWHGLRVPNDMDGVPALTQKAVKKGESFDYSFELPDAGTYWYHAHSADAEQVGRGLAGALIIEEQQPPDVDTDIALLIQDWRLDDKAQLTGSFSAAMDQSHAGHLGNVVTVNGQIKPTLEFAPNERIRLRFINASTARVYAFQLPETVTAWTIAIDGQPVEPTAYSPELLGPGMRVDVILDMPTEAGMSFEVQDAGYDSYVAFSLATTSEVTNEMIRRLEPPQRIQDNPITKPNLLDAEQFTIDLQGGAMSSMGMMGGGNFWSLANDNYVKGKLPTLVLEHQQSYRIRMRNQTRFIHPMHLHGHTFQIISRNDLSFAQGRMSDTVLLQPEEEVEIAFLADNVGDWLFHCHVLGHQAKGMKVIFSI